MADEPQGINPDGSHFELDTDGVTRRYYPPGAPHPELDSDGVVRQYYPPGSPGAPKVSGSQDPTDTGFAPGSQEDLAELERRGLTKLPTGGKPVIAVAHPAPATPDGTPPTMPPAPVAPAVFADPNAGTGAPSTFTPPAPKMVPAHEVALVNPARQGELAGHMSDVGHAQMREGNYASQATEIGGQTHAAKQAYYQKLAKDAADRIEKRKGDFRDNLANLTKVTDEAAAQGIDPERLEKNMTPGQKFAGMLAAMTAGFQAGFNHQTGNLALEMQDRAKEQDIAAQRAKLEQNRGRVGDYKERLAALAQAQQLDEADIRRGEELGLAGIEEGGAAAQAHPLALQQRAAAGEQMYRTQVESDKNGIQMNHWVPAHLEQYNIPKVDAKLIVPLGPGKALIARSEQDAVKLRDVKGATGELVATMSKLRALHDQGASITNPQDRAAFEQQRDAYIAHARTLNNVLLGQGAMSAEDAKNSEAALGVLRGVERLSGAQQKMIDESTGLLQSNLEQRLASQAGSIVQETRDQHGMQAWVPTGGTYNAPAPAPPPIKMTGTQPTGQ